MPVRRPILGGLVLARRAAILLTGSLWAVPSASAQRAEPAAFVVVDTGAPAAAVRRWRARVEAALPEPPVELEAWGRAQQPTGTIEPERLALIAQIEQSLVEAKEAAARLRERDALIALARAEDLAVRSLDIPGMAAWYAEVQLAVAITAAQAGLDGLSESALRRAASVDPHRGVQAAEARPEVVAQGRAAVRASVTGPRGRFEVRAAVPGATVALDDEVLGALPRVVEAPVGPHVLRIDAPGHRSWARVVDVMEGERLPIEVQLSPTDRTLALRRLEAAARSGDVAAVGTLLTEPESRAPRVWILWPGAGSADRAVLIGCEPGGCGDVRRLDEGGLPASLGLGEAPANPSAELSSALRWAAAPEPLDLSGESPWWARWYVWLGVGAVLAAGVTAAVVAAQRVDEGPLNIVVDPSAWAPYVPGEVDLRP